MKPVICAALNVIDIRGCLENLKYGYRDIAENIIRVKTGYLSWMQCFRIVRVASQCTWVYAIFFCIFCIDIWKGKHLFIVSYLDCNDDADRRLVRAEILALQSKKHKFAELFFAKYLNVRQLTLEFGAQRMACDSAIVKATLANLLECIAAENCTECIELLDFDFGKTICGIPVWQNEKHCKFEGIIEAQLHALIRDVSQMKPDDITIEKLTELESANKLSKSLADSCLAFFDISRDAIQRVIFKSKDGKEISQEAPVNGDIMWFVWAVLVSCKTICADSDDAFSSKVTNVFKLMCCWSIYYAQSEALAMLPLMLSDDFNATDENYAYVSTHIVAISAIMQRFNVAPYMRNDAVVFMEDGSMDLVSIIAGGGIDIYDTKLCQSANLRACVECNVKIVFSDSISHEMIFQKLATCYSLFASRKKFFTNGTCRLGHAMFGCRLPRVPQEIQE